MLKSTSESAVRKRLARAGYLLRKYRGTDDLYAVLDPVNAAGGVVFGWEGGEATLDQIAEWIDAPEPVAA